MILKRRHLCVIIVLLVFAIGCTDNNKERVIKIDKALQQNTEDVVMGSDTAKHTVFLYASYKCNYCRFLFSRTFPLLKTNYLDKGILKVVIKWIDFTDDDKMNYALKVGSCISQFGIYDKYHELLLVNPEIIESEKYFELVDDLMIDNPLIAECILKIENNQFVKLNTKEFRELKLTGSPTLIINNKAHVGFLSYEKLDKILKKELL